MMGLKRCMDQVTCLRPKEIGNDRLHLFDLGNLLPGHEMLVNLSIPIVSFLSKEHGQEVSIIAQRVLTDTEMRVLLPLLASPSCCPQEVLQASYHCTYEVLLQSIFSADGNIMLQWNELVQEYRRRLCEAGQHKARRVEMRGVYNALYSLRQKLEQLGLTIHSRKDGYYLSSVAPG